MTAVHNLIKEGINALVVCGGDGSLTGADKLRAEWPELVGKLRENGKFDVHSGRPGVLMVS
jgi:6-phosphofructokinase 1